MMDSIHHRFEKDLTDLDSIFEELKNSDYINESVDTQAVGEFFELIADYARNVRRWDCNGFSTDGFNEALEEFATDNRMKRDDALAKASTLEKYII